MDVDRVKDAVEDTTGAVLEAAASMIPLVGGPAAVLVNRAFGSAVQRRNERIFAEISADIQRLHERAGLNDPAVVLSSEEFLAATHRVFRAAQETASSEQRKLLRNALLNGYLLEDVQTQRDRFLAILIQYVPQHVIVLDALRTLMIGRTHKLENAETAIRQHLGENGRPLTVSSYLADLVRDGLVSQVSETEVKDQTIRASSWGQSRTKQMAYSTFWHGISEQGVAFLDFVADPLA